MDANELQPRDIVVSEQPTFDARGNVVKQRTVQFFVGTHGPFTITDSPDILTGAEIRRRIDNVIYELRIALGVQS